jgi:hypothetical protein
MNYRDIAKASKFGPIPQSAMKMGIMGAAIGGTIAAVGNGYQVMKGEQTSAQAISNVAKETLGTGLSAAAAGAAITALGFGGLVGLAGFAAVATISKGLLDVVLFSDSSELASNE